MKTINTNTVKTITLFLNLSLALLFFNACAQPNESNNASNTATVSAPKMDLHTAVLYGNLEAVNQHIAAGTDLNAKEPMGGSTALISAITFNHTAIAQALIEAGADLTPKNSDGSTALHVAAFFCRVELVQLLLDENADKTAVNNYGATALQSVSGPFEEIKPAYEMIQQQLSPFGLHLNMEELEKTRPVIAMMLQ